MKVNRRDILHRLLCVCPGLSKRGGIHQSACVILKKGRFYTLSQEIACSVGSELPTDLFGAVEAIKLIETLKQSPDDWLELEISNKTLTLLGGKRRKTHLLMEEEITLPIGEVELPKEWTILDIDFFEAVELTHQCTAKSANEFARQCVHIHPEYLEASDNSRFVRYTLKTFVKDSILVRGESLKAIIPFGMTKAAETENWLHYRNPLGLRISVKKFALEAYPSFVDFLKIRGRKVTFPKELQNAALRAGIFAEGEEQAITVKVSTEGLFIEGKNTQGKHEETLKLKYKGTETSFSAPAKMLSELIEKYNELELTESSLRVDGGKFVLLFCLGVQ